MKIIKLEAENIKRLRALSIEPDGNLVVISGRNAQGKTSVLDAIWLALGGGAASRETPDVVRHGEKSASVTVDLGDFTVTRSWSKGTSSLKVMSKDGMSPNSPQKFLDERLGALSFDPLAFANSSAKEQLATLLGLVELPFDPSELAAERAEIFETRTEVNRGIKPLEGQLAAALDDEGDGNDLPADELSAQTVLDEKTAHDERVADYAARLREDAQAETAWRDSEQALAEATARLAHTRARLAATPEPEPVDFTAGLASIEAVNARIRLREERRRVKALIAQRAERSQLLTERLDEIDGKKARALAEARMPLEGLGFDDEGVTYRGVPFVQASGAERLRVSTAMAMALNPTIRVIRITDGSLLDGDNLAAISEMADAEDFQVWIECVNGGVGFVIEDGEVVERPESELT